MNIVECYKVECCFDIVAGEYWAVDDRQCYFKKKKERKSIYVAPFIYCVISQSAQAWITQKNSEKFSIPVIVHV